MGTVDGMRRRRSRQGLPRPRTVQFSLSEEEFAEVSEAAARSGLARARSLRRQRWRQLAVLKLGCGRRCGLH